MDPNAERALAKQSLEYFFAFCEPRLVGLDVSVRCPSLKERMERLCAARRLWKLIQASKKRPRAGSELLLELQPSVKEALSTLVVIVGGLQRAAS